jgi:hypothetical protein
LDTCLEVYDAQDQLLADDDDSGEDYNARIEVFVAAGKTYRVKLRSYDEDEEGKFSILLNYKPLPQPTELHFGTSLSGRLSSGDEHWFSVRSPSKAGILVVETHGDTDTFLKVYDSLYNFISGDDDGGEGYNALVEIFAEPDKTYLIKLKCYDKDERGRYSISADLESVPGDEERNTERSRAIAIRLGEAFQVFFRTETESRWFRYDLQRTAKFVVQTRGNMDTQLYLYDSNGELIAEDDDSGENMNALVSQRLNAGTYYIEIKTYEEDTGRCTIHAETR